MTGYKFSFPLPLQFSPLKKPRDGEFITSFNALLIALYISVKPYQHCNLDEVVSLISGLQSSAFINKRKIDIFPITFEMKSTFMSYISLIVI